MALAWSLWRLWMYAAMPLLGDLGFRIQGLGCVPLTLLMLVVWMRDAARLRVDGRMKKMCECIYLWMNYDGLEREKEKEKERNRKRVSPDFEMNILEDGQMDKGRGDTSATSQGNPARRTVSMLPSPTFLPCLSLLRPEKEKIRMGGGDGGRGQGAASCLAEIEGAEGRRPRVLPWR